MIRRFISLIVIVWLLGFAAFAVTLPRPLGPMKTDAIIVPTGGPGRIETGLERLEAGDARRMLITGVNRDVKPSELAAEYGRPVAVFDCCVSLGFDASDTRSNALEVSRWLVRR
ncbi:MAG: YdcF family protein, partial [Sphingomonadales bacterium]|nr:YdcF family protein [Sphingomonadales bacterium]